MKMTETGKTNPLVEMMSQVFFACEQTIATGGHDGPLIALSIVVCRDFIPFISNIQDMKLIPPLTALRNAERRFVQYGNDILEGMIRNGQINHQEGKTNVSDLHPVFCVDIPRFQLLKSLYAASQVSPKITRRHVATEVGTTNATRGMRIAKQGSGGSDPHCRKRYDFHRHDLCMVSYR